MKLTRVKVIRLSFAKLMGGGFRIMSADDLPYLFVKGAEIVLWRRRVGRRFTGTPEIRDLKEQVVKFGCRACDLFTGLTVCRGAWIQYHSILRGYCPVVLSHTIEYEFRDKHVCVAIVVAYPSKLTGVYTTDPQFGNVLRNALDLGFTVLGYDFRTTKHEEREEFAATILAKLFQSDSETKLLVHAGHAHVLKYETELGERWLASLLWEKTGIEPFTIWQWSNKHDAHDYEKIVSALKARGVSFEEPVLLMPPPAMDSGLQDSPYRLASVDAIVLYPPNQSVAPAKRTVLFPDAMRRLAGRWTANEWPVVVSAYRQGEPINAIPLDQVMLRQDETDFVLWIPNAAEYEIRVFNSDGLLNSRVDTDADFISVRL